MNFALIFVLLEILVHNNVNRLRVLLPTPYLSNNCLLYDNIDACIYE